MNDPADPLITDPVRQHGDAVVLGPPPRIWSAIAVPILAIGTGAIFAGIVLLAAFMFLGIRLDQTNMESATMQLFSEPFGIWLAVLPGQLVFLAAAFGAASFSRIPTRRRLQLGRGQMPVWTWIVFAIATPSVGIATTYLVEAAGIEWSAHLQMMGQLLSGKTGMQLVITAVLVAALPGLAEEILFRGYLQSRLLACWTPQAAIAISAAVFAIAHIDPLHSLLVYPLGIWLGIVALRSGSIWPAVLCHMTNNLLAVVMAQFQTDSLQVGPVEMALLIPSGLTMLAGVAVLLRKPSAPSQL